LCSWFATVCGHMLLFKLVGLVVAKSTKILISFYAQQSWHFTEFSDCSIRKRWWTLYFVINPEDFKFSIFCSDLNSINKINVLSFYHNNMTDLWIFFVVLKDWRNYLPRFVMWGEVQIVTEYKEMNDMQIIYILLATIIYSIKKHVFY